MRRLIVRQVPIAGLFMLTLIAGALFGASPAGAGTSGSCEYSLTATVSGGGGFIGVGPNSSFACPDRTYHAGTRVMLIATADPGYAWESWTGTDDNSIATTFVTMNSDQSVKVTFMNNCSALTHTVSGSGGFIGVGPGSTGGCPDGQYSPGTQVMLIATADPGYAWDSWTGTDDNSIATTFVTMNGDQSVKATFSNGGSAPTNTPAPTSTPAPPTSTPPAVATSTPPPTSTPPAGPTATPTNTQAPNSTSTPVPTSQPTAGPASGDVNCDGRTSSIDAALVLQFSAGLVTTLPCLDQGDILDDDVVNALDAVVILQIAAALL